MQMQTEKKLHQAVVTVMGKDRPGIIAQVSTALFEKQVNVVDLSQTVLGDIFHMVMLVELPEEEDMPFGQLTDRMQALQTEMGMQIRLQRMEIFDAMHRI